MAIGRFEISQGKQKMSKEVKNRNGGMPTFKGSVKAKETRL